MKIEEIIEEEKEIEYYPRDFNVIREFIKLHLICS
jgi:hypothetical protein